MRYSCRQSKFWKWLLAWGPDQEILDGYLNTNKLSHQPNQAGLSSWCNAVLLQAIQILKGIACLSTRSGDFWWVSQHMYFHTNPTRQAYSPDVMRYSCRQSKFWKGLLLEYQMRDLVLISWKPNFEMMMQRWQQKWGDMVVSSFWLWNGMGWFWIVLNLNFEKALLVMY